MYVQDGLRVVEGVVFLLAGDLVEGIFLRVVIFKRVGVNDFVTEM